MREEDNIRKATLLWAALMLGFMAVGFSITAVIVTIVNGTCI